MGINEKTVGAGKGKFVVVNISQIGNKMNETMNTNSDQTIGKEIVQIIKRPQINGIVR